MFSNWINGNTAGSNGESRKLESDEVLKEDENEKEGIDVTPRSVESETSFWSYGDEYTARSDPCLEGNLLMRKGRATGHGSVLWKKRYVHLSFANGGSISVYKETPESIKHQENQTRLQSHPPEGSVSHRNSLYSRFHRRVSAIMHDPIALENTTDLLVFIPNHLPWTAKDVDHSNSTFVIEIPTDGNDFPSGFHLKETMSVDQSSAVVSVDVSAEEDLYEEMATAREKGKPVRIYFRCRRGNSEKALWLEALSRIDRLSLSTRHRNGFMSALAIGVRWRSSHLSRTRTESNHQFALDNQRLDDDFDNASISSDQSRVTERVHQLCFGKPFRRGGKEKNEYKVLPNYAYPHRWMTISELHSEMIAPSSHFYDLRDSTQNSEIGHLDVEVLQCVGLPRLDRNGDTDAVVYLVCGPHAFVTDVIQDRSNPMWLRRTKRACIFPIYHGYARLYVGVFDDDGEKNKDDFAGRVVVDIARLRHSSTYDVTMPLRLSTHAYSRRKRGSVRLRFTLHFKNEKDVLLSYIPKRWKFTLPQHSKPNLSTTIACADPKAFRNVALTVHGVHLPGRFTFPKIKAAIREINFTRKFVMETIRQEIQDTRKWVNPTMSGFVFCAWMHCIYADKVSLVPGYFVLYLLLQLIRTYAVYLVEGPYSEGFVPPTWEEMFHALILPRTTTSIKPLDLHRTSPISSTASLKSNFVEMKTHDPKGRFLFRCLGFLPWEDPLSASPRNWHLEFPFADGHTYPRITVRDAVADPLPDCEDKLVGVKHYDDDDSQFEAPSSNISLDESSTALSPVSSRRHVRFSKDVLTADASKKSSTSASRDGESDSSDDSGDEDQEVDQTSSAEYEEEDQHDKMRASLRKLATGAEALNPMNLIRDQDLDWEGDGNGEKVTESLERIKYKMHSLLWHSFNDYVYDIKDPSSAYFFEAKKEKHKQRRTGRAKSVEKKLDKLLGVKQYSHSNPLVSRLGLYVEPIIDAVYGYLCFFRALFNVTTWQDPYLTFLLTVFLLVLAVILFCIPWRPVLFAVGMLFVGPQNWVIRTLRERGTLPPQKHKERTEDAEEEVEEQIFHSHKRAEGVLAPKPPPEVHPQEVQRIVVPYGHLIYQRFYDWPPEQGYATVVPSRQLTLKSEVSDLSMESTESSRRQKGGTRYPRLHKLRRRIQTIKTRNGKPTDLSQLLEESSEFGEDDESSNTANQKRTKNE